ncbi:hypothetical protein EXIGLDRAFT_719716 [Exidia glandulosa HHB12029]|uniref:Uncharacterized protein n=1 Tax=Exidia glandulosa HHB12029 TaxID=1314781 RepID=A0A165DFM4_EXIGL|nr:hypothetical protein EXIGLDRAFT_727241 [Exidia glandulosa HHB12029]KZV91094.1 hypothetical protein EXIGLDRAFT_719716 [Exidia glandulosa HHB12029]
MIAHQRATKARRASWCKWYQSGTCAHAIANIGESRCGWERGEALLQRPRAVQDAI